jgi:hypothetical protein
MEPTPNPVNPPQPPVEPPAPQPPVPPAPVTPLPNVMVGDGGMPAPDSAQTFKPIDPTAPASSRRMPPKKILIPIIAVLVLLVGGATWYFGYYMNPSVIYKQSMKNTGKGYDKLVSYVDQQQNLANQGYTGSGSYKVEAGDFSTDGKVALKSNSDDSQLTFDVGLGVTRVNADIRTFKSSGSTPDVYVKATDIKGLGTVIGVPALDASLAKLDDSWIVIDHTFIDNLSGIATSQADASSMQEPTRDQILDEARAFGKVNQDYLFSTDKNKAVTQVVQKVGTETIDGHKTYHYKAALQKDNVKKYIYAQRDALKATTLNDWLEKNKYDKEVYASFDDAAKSTKEIKSTDTYDVWMDVSNRVVYKVRFSEKKNPASNYVDIGLNYQGKDVFPFFISGKSKTGTGTTAFSFATTLNTKSNDINLKLDVKATGSDPAAASATFDFKPSSSTIKISKPSGAKPLSQVLSELGLGDALNQYTSEAAAQLSPAP